ncbi:MAG: sel1 repeat family protein [Methylophaga sp.]|nr:sel1 repeat family protein [Methylophaga sp.]
MTIHQKMMLTLFFGISLIPLQLNAEENQTSLNIPVAIELFTTGGIDADQHPNQYEKFAMDLVTQIDEADLEQLESLAEQGNVHSQTLMGLIYSLPNEEGEGRVLSNMVMVPSPKMQNYVENFQLPVTDLVERDPDKSKAYLEEAAAEKNTLAETLLAEAIMQTEGQRPDFEKSRDYFHRAALKQHLRAQIGLLQVSAILEEDVDPAIMRQIFSEITGQ